MKPIDVEELKQVQLNILREVAAFCDAQGLRYFLAYGTLLGAVRHKGFIPWDDDIDIKMPRPDYNRFIQSFQHEYLRAYCWEKNSHFRCPFIKVADTRTEITENGDFGEQFGVAIDIFPVDGLPEGEKRVRRTIRKMKFLWGMIVCATVKDISHRSPTKKLEIRVMRLFYKLFPLQDYFTGLTVRQAQKYPFDHSGQVATLVWGYGKKEVISHSTASEYADGDFEGYRFHIPRNYDEYLTQIYGDYMQLPPEEKRVYRHGIVASWK